MIKRAMAYLLILLSVLILGLVVIPALTSRSGILVYSGNSFSFQSNDFLRIPFATSHNASLSGTFQSSDPVYVYVLNFNQFLSFDDNGGYCPISGVPPLFINATDGSIARSVEGGSYSLIFCAPFQPPNSYGVQVQMTSSLKLSS